MVLEGMQGWGVDQWEGTCMHEALGSIPSTTEGWMGAGVLESSLPSEVNKHLAISVIHNCFGEAEGMTIEKY